MLFVQLQQAPVADLVVAKAVQQPQAAASVAAGKVRKPRRSRRGDLPTRFSPRQQEKKQKAAEAQARICLQESGIIPQGGAPAAPEMALPQAVPQLPVEQLPADEQDMIDAEDVSLFNAILLPFIPIIPESTLSLFSTIFLPTILYTPTIL